MLQLRAKFLSTSGGIQRGMEARRRMEAVAFGDIAKDIVESCRRRAERGSMALRRRPVDLSNMGKVHEGELIDG